MRFNRSLTSFVPTLLATALAACGGGGGGDEGGASTSTASGIPTSAAGASGDITSANYTTVALQVKGVLDASSDATGALNPASTSAPFGTTGARAQAAAGKVFSASTSLGRKTIQSAGGTSRTLGVSSYTEACSGGGSVTATFNDADNNGTASAGDSIAVSAANCLEGTDRLNGSATVTIGGFSDTHIALAMQLTAMSVNDVTLSGGACVVLDYNGYDFAGQLAISNATLSKSGAPTVKLSFSQTVSYKDATGIVTTSTQGGVVIGTDSYWMQQLSPFQGYLYAGHPFTGSLSVVDKDGDRVVGVATASSMRYEFYKAGNHTSTPDAVTTVPNT